MYLQFKVLTRAVAKPSLLVFSTNSRPDKSSIPCFRGIYKLRKGTVAKTCCLLWYEYVTQTNLKNSQQDIFTVILLESKTLSWGEKIFWQNFLPDIFDAILLEICKTRPMDAFHHFLMELPALPWCALPFSHFFYSIFFFFNSSLSTLCEWPPF